MNHLRQQQPLTAFEEAVQQDVQGNASKEQVARLEAQPQDWLDVLVDLKRSVELQFSRRRADLKEYQQQCLALGPDGKSSYFVRKTEYDSWRAKALGYSTAVERCTKQARRLVEAHPKTHEDLTTLCARARDIIVEVEEATDVQQWLNDYKKVTRKAS